MVCSNSQMVIGFTCIYVLWQRYILTTSQENSLREYCQNEEFSVECSLDSIISIISAEYGRMQIKRCIKKDYGFVGCKTNVLRIMDAFCSGRRSCKVRIPNEQLDRSVQKICPEDFKSHLEANYECVKVVHVSKPTCRNQRIRSEPEGVIASIVTMETDCGSHELPWRIELAEGQRINVTLYDFAAAAAADSKDLSTSAITGVATSSGSRCVVAYAIFKEPSNARSLTLCGQIERASTAYISSTDKLQIVILKREDVYFILKYKAIGCGAPAVPFGGWTVRIKDEAMFGCNYSSTSWNLKCHDSKWLGKAYNCTVPENTLGLTGTSLTQNLSFEMAVGAVVFIALIIASVILCVGIILIKKYGRPVKPIVEMIPTGSPLYDVDNSDCMIRHQDQDRESEDQFYRDFNDYAYIDSNQQLQNLSVACSRHVTAIAPFSGHVVCEISRNEISHSSRAQTPYSTLERNTDSSAGLPPPAPTPTGDGSTSKVENKKLEKMAAAAQTKPDWCQILSSCSDSVLQSNIEPAKRFSYQVKAVLK